MEGLNLPCISEVAPSDAQLTHNRRMVCRVDRSNRAISLADTIGRHIVNAAQAARVTPLRFRWQRWQHRQRHSPLVSPASSEPDAASISAAISDSRRSISSEVISCR